MTSYKGERTALIRLADTFVDDILSMTDEAIMAEAREDHTDPSAVATHTIALFEQAAASAGKGRLAAAKAALADRVAPTTATRIEPTAARRRLDRLLAHDAKAAGGLTLAARNGQGLSDDDVRTMLEDLAELGIVPDEVDR